MLPVLKYPSLALAVCLIAVPLARGEGEKKENKEDAKAVIAVFRSACWGSRSFVCSP
jgi:hypothetical protein